MKLVDNFKLKGCVLDKPFRKLINHAHFAVTKSSAFDPK